MNKYSQKQAYCAFAQLINDYFFGLYNDDIRPLLGDIQLLDDDLPGDPASLEEWADSCKEILNDAEEMLNAIEAFDCMIKFLEKYTQYNKNKHSDAHQILLDLQTARQQDFKNSELWQHWLKILDTTKDSNNRIGYYIPS